MSFVTLFRSVKLAINFIKTKYREYFHLKKVGLILLSLVYYLQQILQLSTFYTSQKPIQHPKSPYLLC